MRVQWLTGDTSMELPADVARIALVLFTDEDAPPQATIVTVANLDERPDGRPFLTSSLLDDLPTGRPIRLVVEGHDEVGAVDYVGHVGPLVLAPGERRFVDLKMYSTSAAATVNSSDVSGRAAPTATELPDGRVLVAGGFDRLETMTDCPADVPAEALCFELAASDGAFVFDPTTGTFHPIAGGMLEARGGHTATALPGGRVLLAGGAARMLLSLTPLMPTGYAYTIRPLREDGSEGALATFEIFLPGANAESIDVDRDGDPGRGAFTGAADLATTPGRLNHERFMHAAAVVPGESARVLLAGGMGSDGGSTSFEVYDDQRPGGYGAYDAIDNRLTATRTMPSAVALTVPDPGGSIWIVGGALATSNDELAEIWTPGDTPNGSVAPATDTFFPGAADAATDPRPEYAFVAPAAAALGGGTHAIVVDWIGPRCAPGTMMPMFPTVPDGSDTVGCGHSVPGAPGALLIDGTTGATFPQTLMGPHAFAEAATLDGGEVLISAGLAGIDWRRQQVVEVLTGEVTVTTVATGPARNIQGRAFHAAAPLADRGMLAIGGLSVVGDPATVSLLSAGEVLYLPRASLGSP